MGKTKEKHLKEKKFDRNVEISAPILDPEIIKAIHTPPKGQRLDIRHGGFKALLSDLNSQDSMDELTPITDNHIPSYIGVSCAVSGYSGYSSYNSNRKPLERTITTTKTTTTRVTSVPNRSQTSSPIGSKDHQVKHITIDKSNISSADEERIRLTEELTASATERRLSPSPMLPPEDERHHGAYVGARYCPMPPPSKLVNKHIPLLGIDDDQDPDEVVVEDANKVEKKIASLYGDEFVEDWRESMSHKAKKEHLATPEEQSNLEQTKKSPKDLVTLKATPKSPDRALEPPVEVPTPKIKVLEGVEKQFLTKLLTDENPPMPKSPSPQPTSPVSSANQIIKSSQTTSTIADNQHPRSPPPQSPTSTPAPAPAQPKAETAQEASLETESSSTTTTTNQGETGTTLEQSAPESNAAPLEESPKQTSSLVELMESDLVSPTELSSSKIATQQDNLVEYDDDDDDYDDQHSQSPPRGSPKPQAISPDLPEENLTISEPDIEQNREEHIEYEIRASSPVDNQCSPVRILANISSNGQFEPLTEEEPAKAVADSSSSMESDKPLVSFSPEPTVVTSGTQGHEDEQISAEHQLQQQPLSSLDLLGDNPVASQETGTLEPEANSAGLDMNDAEASDQSLDSVVETTAAAAVAAITATTTTTTTSDLVDAPATDPDDQQQPQPQQTKVAEEVDSDNNNNGLYYLNLLEEESSFIRGQVERAEAILAEREAELDEDSIGGLRSAIGKANLLVNKKFQQFREICERSINIGANEQYAVLNDDLAGFWDMLAIQVADVRRSFEKFS